MTAYTTPKAFAADTGVSPRHVRKLARELGACHILGNRMFLTRENVIAILASQGAETDLLTTNLFPPLPSAPPPPVPSIHVPKQGYIYVIDCGGFIKIGYSTEPKLRLNSLRSSSPYEITLLQIVKGTLADEQSLLKRFAEHRVRGEWFRLSPEIQTYIDEGWES